MEFYWLADPDFVGVFLVNPPTCTSGYSPDAYHSLGCLPSTEHPLCRPLCISTGINDHFSKYGLFGQICFNYDPGNGISFHNISVNIVWNNIPAPASKSFWWAGTWSSRYRCITINNLPFSVAYSPGHKKIYQVRRFLSASIISSEIPLLWLQTIRFTWLRMR